MSEYEIAAHPGRLDLALRAVSAAEQGRDQQRLVVAALTDQPEARAEAEHVLEQIERSLEIAQMHSTFVQMAELDLDLGKGAAE